MPGFFDDMESIFGSMKKPGDEANPLLPKIGRGNAPAQPQPGMSQIDSFMGPPPTGGSTGGAFGGAGGADIMSLIKPLMALFGA